MITVMGGWLLAGVLATATGAGPERYEFSRPGMGVPFRIVLYAPSEEAATEAAEAAFARIQELDHLLSDYDSKSELMRLCRDARPGRPVMVSAELACVLARSQDLARRSGGAFDVTVGPFVRLWRASRKTGRLPPEEALSDARKRVGFRFLEVNEEKREVKLLREGMQLDLGGIAKGYAADEALAELRRHGISSALVDAGGDISTGAPPPGRDGWRIGIAPLDAPDGVPSRYVQVSHAAVATSGDAYQAVEIDGHRYSHIVNPETGLGLTDRSSVTVIAKNGATADGLASAVSVLGPKKGIALVEKTSGAAALVVRVEDGEPVAHTSRGFEDHLAPETASPHKR